MVAPFIKNLASAGRARTLLSSLRAYVQFHAIPVALMAACTAVSMANAAEDAERWKKIAPYFTPPPEYAGKLGDYRSVLLFESGTPVKTPADWQRRRREILDHWHKVMGAWPELINRP